MICFVSKSAKKDRPEPMRPSNASRYQTSSVQREWPLSHGGVHSLQEHLYALLELADRLGFTEAFVGERKT